jgi:hypothetical protein
MATISASNWGGTAAIPVVRVVEGCGFGRLPAEFFRALNHGRGIINQQFLGGEMWTQVSSSACRGSDFECNRAFQIARS